jgi:hypothetical protein
MLSSKSANHIRGAVSLAGKILSEKLQPTPEHPTRNPYAHVWKSIKEKMGKSYSECDESQVQEIIDHISTLIND